MSGWRMTRLHAHQAATYTAVLLGEGFQDPPLRLFPGMRWYHVAVLAALAFVLGVVIYNSAGTP